LGKSESLPEGGHGGNFVTDGMREGGGRREKGGMKEMERRIKEEGGGREEGGRRKEERGREEEGGGRESTGGEFFCFVVDNPSSSWLGPTWAP
jgi:hypothetical protein